MKKCIKGMNYAIEQNVTTVCIKQYKKLYHLEQLQSRVITVSREVIKLEILMYYQMVLNRSINCIN